MKFWNSIRKYWEPFYHRYGRYIPTASLVAGMFWDAFLLYRPDRIFPNTLIVGYLVSSAGFLIILNVQRARFGKEPALWLLAFIQFCYGSLTSAFIMLYVKSGTLVGSALFIAILAAMLIANEYIRDRYGKILVQVSVWYGLLVAYLLIAVPLVVGQIGDQVFLLSMAVSLAIVAVLLFALYAVASRGLVAHLMNIAGSVVLIAAFFAGSYFYGVIPPVPLMPRELGVYHQVTHQSNGDYLGSYEKPYWFEFWLDTSHTYTLAPGETTAYCASSVFAPANIEAPIFHIWEYYDGQSRAWVQYAVIPFSIHGGRDNGYRGYTEVTVTPGKWRCNVETQHGALIGRFNFTVTLASSTPHLSQRTF